MRRLIYLIVGMILSWNLPDRLFAEPLKTFIPDFKVSSTEATADLPLMLQRMLASRLNANLVQLVDAKNKAELVITGSYTTFGKMFSLDLALQQIANGELTSLFEQGSGQDDIIPAMGRLARKTDAAIAGHLTAHAPAGSPAVQAPLTHPPVVTAPAAAGIVQPAKATGEYIIHSQATTVPATDPTIWESSPLDGSYSSLAVGQALTAGEREIFIAGENAVSFFMLGTDLVEKDKVTVALPAKVLAIDAADLDRDGKTELYVTILDRNMLTSRIYTVEDGRLKLTASKLPWFFRGIGLTDRTRTIYVQKMGLRGEFLNGVAALTKNGANFDAGTPLQLPRFGTIFTFNRLQDSKGREHFIVLDQDGYLVIHTAKGEEVWKSADKFGGSETYFVHSSFTHFRSTREKDHPSFLEQRITVLPDQTVLVPTNSGSFGLGNNRNYSKHAFNAFKWNSSMLKEVWHTQPSPSYLADYVYLADTKSLLLLEITQKSGFGRKGKSVLSIKRIE